LVSEVVKPAEAEAERIRILSLADAEKMKIQAEAAASHNRVALDRMLIDQLPEIVKQAASGLAGANVTVLNGADGIGEIASGLVGQGMAIFESLRGGIRHSGGEDTGELTDSSGAAGRAELEQTRTPPAAGARPLGGSDARADGQV
jgi:flotillin